MGNANQRYANPYGVSNKNGLYPSLYGWKKCSGFQDCSATSGSLVSGGTLLDNTTLDEYDSGTTYIRDWSQCCQICSETSGCEVWDFDADTGICNLWSQVSGYSENSSSQFYGFPGADDPKLICDGRPNYDTCW